MIKIINNQSREFKIIQRVWQRGMEVVVVGDERMFRYAPSSKVSPQNVLVPFLQLFLQFRDPTIFIFVQETFLVFIQTEQTVLIQSDPTF